MPVQRCGVFVTGVLSPGVDARGWWGLGNVEPCSLSTFPIPIPSVSRMSGAVARLGRVRSPGPTRLAGCPGGHRSAHSTRAPPIGHASDVGPPASPYQRPTATPHSNTPLQRT